MAQRCFCGTVLRENGLPCQHCGNGRTLRASSQQGQFNSRAPLLTPENSSNSMNSRCPPTTLPGTLRGNLEVSQPPRTRALNRSEPVGGGKPARDSPQSSLPATKIEALNAYNQAINQLAQDLTRSRQRIQQQQSGRATEQFNMEQYMIVREEMQRHMRQQPTPEELRLQQQQQRPLMPFQRRVRFADNHTSEIPRSNTNSTSGEPDGSSQQVTRSTETSQQSAQHVPANIPLQPTQASDPQHTVEVPQVVIHVESAREVERPATPLIMGPVTESNVTDAPQRVACLAEDEDANKGHSDSEDEWILLDADMAG